MYDFIVELGNIIWKNGLSLSMLGSLVFLFLRQRKVKKIISKRLPWVMHDSDVANYEARQIRIEQDVRAIKEHLGVKGWDADSKIGRIEQSVTTGTQKRSSSPQAGYAHVIIARYFTRLKETYHLSQRRMNMKSKLLSRKFLMAVISAGLVIANDGLNLGLDQNTIIAFGTIVVGWIASESIVDVSKKKSDISSSSYTTKEDAGEV